MIPSIPNCGFLCLRCFICIYSSSGEDPLYSFLPTGWLRGIRGSNASIATSSYNFSVVFEFFSSLAITPRWTSLVCRTSLGHGHRVCPVGSQSHTKDLGNNLDSLGPEMWTKQTCANTLWGTEKGEFFCFKTQKETISLASSASGGSLVDPWNLTLQEITQQLDAQKASPSSSSKCLPDSIDKCQIWLQLNVFIQHNGNLIGYCFWSGKWDPVPQATSNLRMAPILYWIWENRDGSH